MSILIVTAYLIAGFSKASLPSKFLLEQAIGQPKLLLSSQSFTLPLQSFNVMGPPLMDIIEEQCQEVPVGDGIPGFQPGLEKNDVLRMLGVPTGSARGYWPNTSAVFYELIPDQVSLGFLFDRHSQRIRQTEASFTDGIDSKLMLITLNGMLGCKLNQQIEQGLEQVRQRKSRQYYFKMDSLKGVIERQKSDRLYIGIWEADLH